MKFNEEFSTLIIVGQWNSAIFNPDWVAKYLLPDTKLEIEIPVNINGSLRFSTDELRFFVLADKLNLAILKQGDEIYSKIGDIAYNLVNYLPHTPVSAFGLNYLFTCDKSEEIDLLFKLSDESLINDSKFTMVESQIKRSLKKDKYILNLAINKNINNYNITLNYHFDIQSLAEFKDKFEPSDLVKFKEDSLMTLNNLYNLDIE